jgi:deferrochelatase/peroxidase EfeB
MKPDVTSRHLRTSTELTVIAPIKQGFIEYVDTVTYASRLRMLLSVLFELRKGADERSASIDAHGKQLEYVGPLERLQMLHFVQWAIIDNDTRLMLNVTFDRSWESYIRDIVDVAGPLLDIILCHCADYEGHSTNLGYETFATWVREHQVKNDFFYAAEPALTSDDHRYHRELAELPSTILFERRTQKPPVAAVAPIGPDIEARLSALRVTIRKQSNGTIDDLHRIAGALFDLRRYFAGTTTEGEASYLSAAARQVLVFYDEIAYLMLSGFDLEDRKAPPKNAPALVAWYVDLPKRKRSHPQAKQAMNATIPSKQLKEIQRGLLRPFEKTTHGCVVLVQWSTAAAGARFLKHVSEKISFEDSRTEEATSLALTFRGLKSLGLSEEELRGFPKELREGMEARSGILGDVKASHPSTWKMPKANWVEAGESALRDGEPVALGSVDAVLVVQTCASTSEGDYEWSGKHPLEKDLQALVHATGVRVLHVQALRREYKGDAMIEHFGFRDDISQPHVAFEGGEERAVLARDRVAPGEIVLGYPNARGETVRFAVDGVQAPLDRDLLRNGSFMVLRKLKQDVEAFNKFLDDGEAALGVSRKQLAEQMMGRSLDEEGKPLGTKVIDPNDKLAIEGMAEQQRLNSFDFSEKGVCPFHAHIRRMNPRDELPPAADGEQGDEKAAGSNTPQRKTPRILRRSFAYGPARSSKEHGERGLMFMAFNASIADQYEILQRWISGGNSTGLPSSLADLISGASDAAVFPVQVGKEVRWLPAPERPLVEVQWGMYAFVPSRSAIDQLADRAKLNGAVANDAEKKRLLARGVVLINKLLALPDAVAKVEWKRLLENREAIEDTRAIWGAVVFAHGGALRTPYGVLVAGSRNVYEVLGNSKTYSVREYWHRMVDSIGAMHLGMDPAPQPMPQKSATAKDREYEAAVTQDTYATLAKPLNVAMAQISINASFEGACTAADEVLKMLPVSRETGLVLCDLRDVAAAVLQIVSAKTFGMPSLLGPDAPEPEGRSSLSDFRQCSAYVFTPNPEPWVAQGARDAAENICKAYRFDNYKAIREADAGREAAAKLPPSVAVPDPHKEALAAGLKGAAFGFLAATLGSVVSTLLQWAESGELWKIQQALKTFGQDVATPAHVTADRKSLETSILEAMQRGPVPPVLHRHVVQPAQLGPVSLVPGDRVIASLATAAAESKIADPEGKGDFDVMFGGKYNVAGQPVHACPGRDMAIGVMTGLVWTLLRQHDIRRVSEINPLKVTFKRR